jgi:hypothetical protein
MGKTFKETREYNTEENKVSKKSKYTRKEKIRFALDMGAKELKIIVNGKPVDSEYIGNKNTIHQ